MRRATTAILGALLAAAGCGTDGGPGPDGGVGPAADYALSLAPVALAVVQGATGTATVTIARTNFSGAVTLSVGNAPAGVTASFNGAAPTGTSSTLTVSVGTGAAPGVYNLAVAGAAAAGDRSTPLALTVTSSGGGGNVTGNVTTVTAGSSYSCALDDSGKAFCWGVNGLGQLGTASTETCADPQLGSNRPCTKLPAAVTGGLTFGAVSARYAHTCAVTASGAAYCWGWNAAGQLGIGSKNGPDQCAYVGGGQSAACGRTPVAVTGAHSFATVSARGDHTCAITTSGAAYCWGGDAGNGQMFGQLGDGTTTQRLVPTQVVGGLTFATVSTGFFHTCGVTPDGKAYCWGNNRSGELGDGTTTNRLVPSEVAGDLTFAAVSAGFGHTCGVTRAAKAYCWGDNSGGKLGDGTNSNRLVPSEVAGGHALTAVSAGDVHTCGVTAGGAAYCWGSNRSGELGIGSDKGPDQCAFSSGATSPCSRTPVAVTGGHSFAVMSAGVEWPIAGHTCGVTTGGKAYCWGSNLMGQLGDGTTTQRLVPTAVAFP